MNFAETVLAGENIILHCERALFWPRAGLLAIADLHLGKSQAFRRAGIGLPRGGTSHDLARLDRLIAQFAPRTLLVLGDVLHGALDLESAWLARWLAWRAAHPQLQVQAVLGNHDRALDAAALQIQALGTDLLLPPFRFAHQPAHDDDAYRIAGHVHPVLRLRDTGLSARVPVFWLGATHAVLPAFTQFSGGYEIEPQAGDRLWACGEDTLAALPAAAFVASVRPARRGR
jgi:DNA ligase-associated metallophosphoesterase